MYDERLTAILHTLLCQKPHSERMEDLLEELNPEVCYFYLEESLAEKNELPCHIEWNHVAGKFKSVIGGSDEDAYRALMKLVNIKRELALFLETFPNAEGFALRVLFENVSEEGEETHSFSQTFP